MRRSLERSLDLLGVDRLPLVYLHDPEHLGFADGMAPGGPAHTLAAMRDEVMCDHIGLAAGPADLMRQYLETDLFEVLITHNRMTLLDRGADELIGYAHAHGIGVVNAAVFGGGILVRGQHAVPRYAYRAAPKPVLDVVDRMWWLCADYGVPLGAAALQFSLRDPRITSSIVGASHVEHVRETIAFAGWPIPDDLWDQLVPLTAPRETWLDATG